ncbi:MAG: NAD-binding protein [Candidatus Omnitrophota bacterium]
MRYIVIIGCGKTGENLAYELSKVENVVVVDKSLKNLDSLGDGFNGKKIWADVLDISTLEKAGIKDADAVYLLTGNDNINLVVGKVIKRKYGIKKVILQVNDAMKKKVFKEEGLTIVNRTYLIVEVLKKCILS